jgi:hypothetical protein
MEHIAPDVKESLYLLAMSETMSEFFCDLPGDTVKEAVDIFESRILSTTPAPSEGDEDYFKDFYIMYEIHEGEYCGIEEAVSKLHLHFQYQVLQTILEGYKILTRGK